MLPGSGPASRGRPFISSICSDQLLPAAADVVAPAAHADEPFGEPQRGQALVERGVLVAQLLLEPVAGHQHRRDRQRRAEHRQHHRLQHEPGRRPARRRGTGARLSPPKLTAVAAAAVGQHAEGRAELPVAGRR
jgi:hypothetical protein